MWDKEISDMIEILRNIWLS